MANKLVGYKRGVSSKSGKKYCVASIVIDLTQREKEAGMVGQKVDDIFLPDSCVDMLTPNDIGKELVLTYHVSGARAYLDNVTVK